MRTEPDLERLYDEHAQALFAFLLHFTRDVDVTRDLLQEIFVRLARQPELLRAARNERAFLIRLARNAAIDQLRRRGPVGAIPNAVVVPPLEPLTTGPAWFDAVDANPFHNGLLSGLRAYA